jgi:hypothetical protein
VATPGRTKINLKEKNMLGLTLVQTSPATNPDRNIVKVNFSGTYPPGGDRLPLENILDPDILVRVPLNNPTKAPPPVTPHIWSEWLDGYYTQIQRVVTGVGLAEVTNFLNGEVFLEILCPTVQQ